MNINVILGATYLFILIAGFGGYFIGQNHGIKWGRHVAYEELARDGLDPDKIPWRVSIPTKDHFGQRVTIHVFPEALHQGFVMCVESSNHDRNYATLPNPMVEKLDDKD